MLLHSHLDPELKFLLRKQSGFKMVNTQVVCWRWLIHTYKSWLHKFSEIVLVIKHLLLLLNHFSRVQLCATPERAAHQASPSLGFSRQEHWSGLPFPSQVHESEKSK